MCLSCRDLLIWRITSWCVQGHMLSYIFVVFFFLQTSWKYLFDARWVCRVNFLFNSKIMIRRLAQFWLCRQLLKKEGVKWTKSDFSLLLCIPGQNCKLDFRFCLSKNYRSFDFLSKHNISSELTMCWSYHTSISICSASFTKLVCLTFPTPAFVFNAVC